MSFAKNFLWLLLSHIKSYSAIVSLPEFTFYILQLSDNFLIELSEKNTAAVPVFGNCGCVTSVYLVKSIMILLLRSTNLLMASTERGWLLSIARS